MEFKIDQIFEGEYPPESAEWCNNNHAYIEELKSDDKIRRFKISAIPSLTNKEIMMREYNRELMDKESWLSEHDYIGIKIATGRATIEDYADTIVTMKEYAKRVEELRDLISSLQI